MRQSRVRQRLSARPACRSRALLLGCAVMIAGCATTILPKQPNIGQLYSRSAQNHGPERNPVIVIPGLTGSNLVEGGTGRVVWGVFGGDFAQPKVPEDARLIALPMREGVPLRDLRDGVVSDGVLDRLRVKVLGIPINLRTYYYILQALGIGGYRDESLDVGGDIDWGDAHFTCFQFDYDWRRDNVENAQRLHLFIEEKRAYVQAENRRRYGREAENLKFDIVSHSMGGLLLRYYLRYGPADLPDDGSLPEPTWAGAENVDRAILVATPNAGTIESLVQLIQGKGYGPFASYSPVLLGTFPSGYQMLPRGRHAMVAEGETPIPDLFDPALWLRMGWGLASPDAADMLAWLLPEVDDPGARRRIALDHQRKSLERAGRFTAALDRPLEKPQNLQLYLVAGDAIPTPRQALVEESSPQVSIVTMGAGDGKVLRSSALLDERMDGTWSTYLRSPIEWQRVMFLPETHLDLTKTAIFTNNLLYWLLEEPRSAAP